MNTARLTAHARRRCAERGIPTKLVKQMLRAPDLIARSHLTMPGVRYATSASHPELVVVFAEADPQIVLSVYYRRPDGEPWQEAS